MKIYIESYGCTANIAEGQKLEKLLKEKGHEVVSEEEKSDSVILNTCTVVKSTEDRMIHRMSEVEKPLTVAGCMATAQPEKVKKNFPKASLLRTTGSKEVFGENKFFVKPEPEGVIGTIQIGEGCLGKCTYCITKNARKNFYSLSPSKVKEIVKHLVEKGAKELRLTSQDNGVYGLDTGKTISDIVEKIEDMEKDFKVRIGMTNPASTKKRLNLKKIFGKEKIFDFLHLPLQSGSDKILKKMNRRYSVKTFEEIVEEFRDICPQGTIATDVITGFPGETDLDHSKTINFLEKIKPEVINITRFSPRPKTEAEKMGQQVPFEKKKSRSQELTKLRHKLGEKRYSKHLDKIRNLLVVEKGKPGTVICRDRNYIATVIKKDLELGREVKGRIIKSKSTYLVAEPLNH